MTTEPITVVVCDDVPELRMLMRAALEEDGDMKVIGEAGCPEPSRAMDHLFQDGEI